MWSSCSASCGNGTVTRTRQCNNPAPSGGGSTCHGHANQTRQCLLKECHGKNNGREYLSFAFISQAIFSRVAMMDGLLAILRPFQQYFSHIRTMGRWL